MIDFSNEQGIVEKPNVKLLYEIIHDFLRNNSVAKMDFISLIEIMKYEQLEGEEEDED